MRGEERREATGVKREQHTREGEKSRESESEEEMSGEREGERGEEGRERGNGSLKDRREHSDFDCPTEEREREGEREGERGRERDQSVYGFSFLFPYNRENTSRESEGVSPQHKHTQSFPHKRTFPSPFPSPFPYPLSLSRHSLSSFSVHIGISEAR
jgi:hypothetical protein